MKKENKAILILSVIQIFLLINFSVAQSYNFNNEDINFNLEISQISKKIIKSSLNLLIGFLSIKQIGFVSAGCCEETDDGAFCQPMDTNDACASIYSSAHCDATDSCEKGVCLDESDGTCGILSPKKTCEENEGVWYPNEIEDCEMGCCDLASDDTQWNTHKWCDLRGGSFGSRTRSECVYFSPDKEGACVYQEGGENTCVFNSEEECQSITGAVFHDGFLCSSDALTTDCEKQQSINCEDGKIYWFDFCGNRENVYTTNVDDTDWYNGYVRPKGSEICTVDLNDDNSLKTCGNCDRTTSICKQVDGEIHVAEDNFVCADLGCIDETDGNKPRSNGESWCIYEGSVGEYSVEGVYPQEESSNTGNSGYSRDQDHDYSQEEDSGGNDAGSGPDTGGDTAFAIFFPLITGKTVDESNSDSTLPKYPINISSDIPGSSHYKKSCNQGEISMINCGEYRTQICGENIVKINEGGENEYNFSEAACRPNLGRTCFEIDDMEECEDEFDCRVQSVDVVKNEDIDFFKFEVCVPRYPQGFNPDSESDWNDAESVCGMASMNCPIIQQYKADCVAVNIFNQCFILERVYLGYIANKECDKNPERFYSQMNDFCISLGDCAGYINTMGNYTGRNDLREMYGGLENTAKENITNNPPKWFNILSGISSSSTIALNLINDQRGETPDCPEGQICEETLDEDSKSVLSWREFNFAFGVIGSFLGPYGWIITLVAFLVELVVFKWMGGEKVGEIELSEIIFSCEPWEPPSRSQDCEKCNEGDLPCTAYKCWSLGKNCMVLEDIFGTEEPICVKTDSDPTEPIIEFKSVEGGFTGAENSNNYGVSITNESNNNVDWTKCIAGNTLIDFSLITDKDEENKYARCVWGYEFANYNEYRDTWTNRPNSGMAWTKTHNFSIRLPSYESRYVEEDGNLNLYVRCENHEGRSNVNEYIVKFCIEPTPDTRPPIIERFEPANNGYLKYGSTTLDNLKVYTNEQVASCKYSYTNNILYEDMIELSCPSSTNPQIEYKCSNLLNEITGLTEQENKLYFKCNDTSGNLMTYYKEYTISPSISELKIVSTQPSGYYQVSSFDGISEVTISVITSGGADGTGVAKCYWSDSFAYNKEHDFFETDSTIHTQEKLYLESGDYSIPIRCEDYVGNEAHGNIEFELDVDNIAPEIATIYNSGSSLVITTHEPSRCYYDTESINCDVDTGDTTALMDPKFDVTIEHYVEWDSDKTYHIQCVDILENVGTCVSIIPSVF